jgi:hypothetical protein
MATNDDGDSVTPVDGLGAQTPEEKKFIILVERGDVASIKRLLNVSFQRCRNCRVFIVSYKLKLYIRISQQNVGAV